MTRRRRPRRPGPADVFCVTSATPTAISPSPRRCAPAASPTPGRRSTLGLPPDWLGAELPADEEWRIEWTKFYFGLDLALRVFDRPDERRFLRAWERLVTSWVSDVPVGVDTTDVAARRVSNWIYAWQRVREAPGFAGPRPGREQRAARLASATQVAYLRANLTPARSATTARSSSTRCSSRPWRCPTRSTPTASSPSLALAELDRSLLEGTHDDGVHREGSTHYHLLVLRSFVGRARERAALRPRPPGRIRGAAGARAASSRFTATARTGRSPALSDADSVRYGGAARARRPACSARGDLEWVATRGERGEPPRDSRRELSRRRLLHASAAAGARGRPAFEDERYLIFDCGPLGEGGHGHYDLLSRRGRRRGTGAARRPGALHLFRGPSEPAATGSRARRHTTRFASTPSIRRLTAAASPRGAVAEGRFLGRFAAPGLDALRGEARSPSYDADPHAGDRLRRRRVLAARGPPEGTEPPPL